MTHRTLRLALLPFSLLTFALFLPMLEGPAQVACVLALVLAAAETWRAPEPRALERQGSRLASPWVPAALLLVWAAAGYVGVIGGVLRGEKLSSEDTTRPLCALAFGLGVWISRRADERSIVRLGRVFVFGAVISAAYGLLQAKAGELPWDGYFLKNPRSPQVWVPGKIGAVRAASGLFYNRLKLAHTAIIALVVAVPIFAQQAVSTDRPRRPLELASALVACLLITAGLVASHARMALPASAFGLLVLTLALGRGRLAALTGALVSLFLLGIFFLVPEWRGRLGSMHDDALIRLHLFDTAWGVFRMHPWLGVGHGFYRRVVGATWDGIGMDIDAHNFLLQGLAETGVVGGGALLAAVAFCFVAALRTVVTQRGDGSPSAQLTRAALGGLAAFVLLGATHAFTHHASVFLLFAVLLGVAVGGRGRAHR